MRNYLFIVLTLLIVSCTSETIRLIESEQLVSQTKSGFLEDNQDNDEMEVSSGGLDFLKLLEAITPKVLRSTQSVQYPNYYGGAYINDRGRLIILVTEKPGYYKQIFRRIIGHNDFLVHKCDYSHNRLNECMNEINLYRENNLDYFRDISNLYYISDLENKIYVTLNNFNNEGIEEFKNSVNNFQGIKFIKSEGDLYLASEIKPGMPVLSVFSVGGGSESTLGFRAKRNGVEGVVVSGHAINNGDKLHFDTSTSTAYIGISTAPIIGGSVDCAFVPVDVGTPSNKIYGSQDVLSAQTSDPGAGTFVNFRGRHTSRGGNIVSTSVSATFKFKDNSNKSYNYTNLTNVRLPVTLQHGDSGGIVYSYVSSTNTRYNVGNIVGYGIESGLAFYAKSPQTIAFLNITLY